MHANPALRNPKLVGYRNGSTVRVAPTSPDEAMALLFELMIPGGGQGPMQFLLDPYIPIRVLIHLYIFLGFICMQSKF